MLKKFILFIMLLIEIPFIPFVVIWCGLDSIRDKIKYGEFSLDKIKSKKSSKEN